MGLFWFGLIALLLAAVGMYVYKAYHQNRYINRAIIKSLPGRGRLLIVSAPLEARGIRNSLLATLTRSRYVGTWVPREAAQESAGVYYVNLETAGYRNPTPEHVLVIYDRHSTKWLIALFGKNNLRSLYICEATHQKASLLGLFDAGPLNV